MYINDNNKGVYYSFASDSKSIRPVVYLNSNVKIEEDTSENYGSKDNPYRLSV